MTALPHTGIELVDRELERRGPFSSPEAAQALAAQLLSVWNVLRPCSDVDDTVTLKSQRAELYRR